jgi:hypothetical protein
MPVHIAMLAPFSASLADQLELEIPASNVESAGGFAESGLDGAAAIAHDLSAKYHRYGLPAGNNAGSALQCLIRNIEDKNFFVGLNHASDVSVRGHHENISSVKSGVELFCAGRQTLYIRLSVQLVDVHAGMLFESLCDATADEFPSREPTDLLALRLRLACNGRLVQGDPVRTGCLRSLGGCGRERSTANKYHGDNSGKQSWGEIQCTLP